MPRLLPALLCFLSAVLPAFADSAPTVVVSIRPLHALTAGIMENVAEPVLLMDGVVSPHSYRLTPSGARLLEQADLVIWVHESLESRLLKPLLTLVAENKRLELAAEPRLDYLPVRRGGVWGEQHAHDNGHHNHSNETITDPDPHLWLDTGNVITMVGIISERLQKIDAANAGLYKANAEKLIAAILKTDSHIAAQLADVRQKPYLVFHDSLQYFERRYSLSPAGALTIDPERYPGARRILELRQQIREKNIRCVFIEMQFGTKLAEVLLEGTDAKLTILDTLGLNAANGSEGYLQLLQGLADDVRGCLLK
jgi:zinc transport system substrate-binding protein